MGDPPGPARENRNLRKNTPRSKNSCFHTSRQDDQGLQEKSFGQRLGGNWLSPAHRQAYPCFAQTALLRYYVGTLVP